MKTTLKTPIFRQTFSVFWPFLIIF